MIWNSKNTIQFRYRVLHSDVVLTVEVVDVNDNIPKIVNQNSDSFIPANLGKGVYTNCRVLTGELFLSGEIAFALIVDDPDNDDTVFFVLGGTDAAYFRISSTGIIYANQRML